MSQVTQSVIVHPAKSFGGHILLLLFRIEKHEKNVDNNIPGISWL